MTDELCVARAALHLHLLVLNLAEVQYLIDETKHPTGVPFYHHQLLPCVGRQFIILQHLLHRYPQL